MHAIVMRLDILFAYSVYHLMTIITKRGDLSMTMEKGEIIQNMNRLTGLFGISIARWRQSPRDVGASLLGAVSDFVAQRGSF